MRRLVIGLVVVLVMGVVVGAAEKGKVVEPVVAVKTFTEAEVQTMLLGERFSQLQDVVRALEFMKTTLQGLQDAKVRALQDTLNQMQVKK